jgi:hypothetical protein
MAIGHCVKEAFGNVRSSFGDVLLGERAEELYSKFAKEVVLLSDVDDITVAGEPAAVRCLTRAFAAAAHRHNLGTFQPDKSKLLPLGAAYNEGVIPAVDERLRRDLSIVLLDPIRGAQATQAGQEGELPDGIDRQHWLIKEEELVAVVVDSRANAAPLPGKVVIDGYTAVGASLGNNLFRHRLVEEKRQAVIELVRSEFALDRKQDGLLLHKYGGGLAQITSLLRSISPSITVPVLANQYDNAVVEEVRRNVLSTFGESPLDFSMAQLPMRDGGLGLRSAALLAPRAYLAGFLNAAQFVDTTLERGHFLGQMLRDIRANAVLCQYAAEIHDATNKVACDYANLHGGTVENGPLASPLVAQQRWCKFQAFATHVSDELALISVKRRADVSQLAYLHGSRSPGASAILSVFPTTSRTTYSNDVVSVSIALRLLNKNICGFEQGQLCPSGSQRCAAIVGGATDSHMMWCPTFGATATHNRIVREVRDMLRMSDATLVVSNQEPTVMQRVRGDLLRGGAITQEQYASTGRIQGGDIHVEGLTGRGVIDIFDVTVVVPHSGKALEALRKHPQGSLSDLWEKQKNTKYVEFYAKAGYKFRGLAFEYSGRVGSQVRRLIKECAQRPLVRMPEDVQWTAATFEAHWHQRLVAAVQVDLALRLLEVRRSVAGQRRLRY